MLSALELFEYAHKLEPSLGGRKKAEIFISASIEASSEPESFKCNKLFWVDKFEESGFPADDAETLYNNLLTFLSSKYI